jgi:hypothetical protein
MLAALKVKNPQEMQAVKMARVGQQNLSIQRFGLRQVTGLMKSQRLVETRQRLLQLLHLAARVASSVHHIGLIARR